VTIHSGLFDLAGLWLRPAPVHTYGQVVIAGHDSDTETKGWFE